MVSNRGHTYPLFNKYKTRDRHFKVAPLLTTIDLLSLFTPFSSWSKVATRVPDIACATQNRAQVGLFIPFKEDFSVY